MELKIVEWVAQNLHHPVLDRIMVWITHLGDNGYLWVAVCLLLLCYKPTRKWGGVMALSLLLMLIFGEGRAEKPVPARPPLYPPAQPPASDPAGALLLVPLGPCRGFVCRGNGGLDDGP